MLGSRRKPNFPENKNNPVPIDGTTTKGPMKKMHLVAVTLAALIAATLPVSAQDAPSGSSSPSAKTQPERPRFISKGQRLSEAEADAYAEQDRQAEGRVWPEPGGMSKSAKVWIVVGVVVVVGVAAVAIYEANYKTRSEFKIWYP